MTGRPVKQILTTVLSGFSLVLAASLLGSSAADVSRLEIPHSGVFDASVVLDSVLEDPSAGKSPSFPTLPTYSAVLVLTALLLLTVPCHFLHVRFFVTAKSFDSPEAVSTAILTSLL